VIAVTLMLKMAAGATRLRSTTTKSANNSSGNVSTKPMWV
jgi:hypothetical protein